MYPTFGHINNCFLRVSFCVICIFHKHTESWNSQIFDAYDMQCSSKRRMLPTQTTTPQSSHWPSWYWDMHQAELLRIWWSLTERRNIVISAWPLPPMVSTKVSCRKLLPLFLAMQKCCVNWLESCWTFTWLCNLIHAAPNRASVRLFGGFFWMSEPSVI